MRTLLVSMPFAPLERPSLALSLLKAQAVRAGHSCDVAYFNLTFGSRLGREAYDLIADTIPPTALAGEWVFAEALHGSGTLRDAYPETVLRGCAGVGEAVVADVLRARSCAGPFLAYCMAAVPWQDYDVIGFTSICAQNTASLALAGRLKKAWPHLTLVAGGHNWSGDMGAELLERNHSIDFSFGGEADVAFPRFLDALERGEHPGAAGVPGIMWRGQGGTERMPEAACVDLDALSPPDHHDYFAWLSRHRLDPPVSPVLPVEASRGCWWASRRPCSFCGLVGTVRRYRSKSPRRVVQELRHLATLPAGRLDVVDNVVSPGFLADVVPELASRPLPVPLSLKVRPDIGRECLRSLGAAGASVKVGIESLDDHVLALMNKGTTGLQNLRLLRWCREAGVPVTWNFLSGVPGESPGDYLGMCRLLPSVTALDPPEEFAGVAVERFSAYFEEPERHGFGELRPAPAYRFVYPYSDDGLYRLAYFFEHSYHPGLSLLVGISSLRERVQRWQQEGRGSLSAAALPDGRLVVHDGRAGERASRVELADLESSLLAACDDVCGRGDLLAAVTGEGADAAAQATRVDEALASLTALGYVVRSGDLYLGLVALP